MKKLFTLVMLFCFGLGISTKADTAILSFTNMTLGSSGDIHSDGNTYNDLLSGNETQNTGFTLQLKADKKPIVEETKYRPLSTELISAMSKQSSLQTEQQTSSLFLKE